MEKAAQRGSVVRTFLIADVRGYTVFTNERGDEAAAELASRFAEVARACIEAREGELVELRGDEALAVFDSARQAIRAAVELQRRFVDETIADPSRPLPVGIGLDAGEAVPVGDGYRGGALNLAARLCSVAGPAEILASREVIHLARKVDGVAFVDRGPMTLKGLAEPVHVMRVRAAAEDVADDTAFRRALGAAGARLTPRSTLANPYKGLRPFEEADSENFFGRERVVAILTERLGETRFLAVVGPSGSGKSSVVRAGLLPAVRRGALEGSSSWPIAEMYPGAHPLEELEAALLKIGDDQPASLIETLERDELGLLRAVKRVAPDDGSEVLLLIDQFEEVFTLVEAEARRAHFLDSLRAAVTDPRSRLRIVVTLRADFYDRPLQYFGFGDLLRSRVEALIPLSPDELERAISGPAKRVDARLEDGLVAEMLADVADEPGALPLLQYALTELFERRQGNVLTRAAYREIGGVTGALGRRAEELYAGLDGDGTAAARQLFLRLVALGEGTEDTRRPLPRPEIESLDVDADAMSTVIDAFGAARLLSFDRDSRTGVATIEVAHEALLTAWARLRRWIDDAREELRTQRRVAVASREWEDARRDPSFLARGARLERFEAWRRAGAISITPSEREFLDASIAERDRAAAEEEARAERQRELERRSIRRLRALVAVLAVAAVVAGAVTVFALGQRERAEEERLNATARELASAALASLEEDPERAILLALEAVEQTRSSGGAVLDEAHEALHRAVVASHLVATVPDLGGWLDWSIDDTFVTEGPEDTGMIDVRDATTGDRVLAWRGHEVDVNAVEFSADGSLLATTGDEPPQGGTASMGFRGALKLWDPRSGLLRWEIDGIGEAWGPSISADGSLVAAAWPDDDTVRVLDAASGRLVRTITAPDAWDTALDPSGERIAVARLFEPVVEVYDASTGERLYDLVGHEEQIQTVAWSPDGRWIATGSFDATARIWDATDGSILDELAGHTGFVVAVDWAADSARLVTSGDDGTARLWQMDDAGTHEVLTLSSASRAGIFAAISQDGSRIITGDNVVSAVRIWDVTTNGDAEIANLPAVPSFVAATYLSEDRVVATSEGGATVWDVATRRAVTTLDPPPGDDPASMIAVTNDGERVALARLFEEVLQSRDIATGALAYEATVDSPIMAMDGQPDGEHVVVGSYDGGVTVFDSTGGTASEFDVGGDRSVFDLAVASRGRIVAVGHGTDGRPGGAVSFFDWDDGRLVREIEFGAEQLTTVTADRTGERVAVALSDGSVVIVDVATGRELHRFSANSGLFVQTAFSPDDAWIATGGGDGTVRLFDAETGNERLVLRGHSGSVDTVSFSADGSRLVSAARDGVVRVWALDLDELIELARSEVTRYLTSEECQRYLHAPCDGGRA